MIELSRTFWSRYTVCQELMRLVSSITYPDRIPFSPNVERLETITAAKFDREIATRRRTVCVSATTY